MVAIGIIIISIAVGSLYTAAIGWLTLGGCMIVFGSIETFMNYRLRKSKVEAKKEKPMVHDPK